MPLIVLPNKVVSGPRAFETNGSRGSGNVSLVDDLNRSVGCVVEGFLQQILTGGISCSSYGCLET